MIGTSLQILYTIPMLASCPSDARVFYIDNNPVDTELMFNSVHVIKKPATEGMAELLTLL